MAKLCLKAGLMWQSRSVKLWQTGVDCAGRGSNTSCVDLQSMGGLKTTIQTGLTEQLSQPKKNYGWGEFFFFFFNYLFRKKPFGQDVMSHCRPSTVTTVIYRKSPCSFLCPGGGFQQLRERSFKWVGAWGRKRQSHRVNRSLYVASLLNKLQAPTSGWEVCGIRGIRGLSEEPGRRYSGGVPFWVVFSVLVLLKERLRPFPLCKLGSASVSIRN